MASGIYMIIDAAGKMYIGSAVNLNRRRSDHMTRLANNKHANPKLQNAYNKYGADYFTFKVVEIVEDRTQLLKREQEYLDMLFANYNYDNHYNILPKAGSTLGDKQTDKAKVNMSIGQKRRAITDTRLVSFSGNRKGAKLSDETKAKMRIAALNRKKNR